MVISLLSADGFKPCFCVLQWWYTGNGHFHIDRIHSKGYSKQYGTCYLRTVQLHLLKREEISADSRRKHRRAVWGNCSGGLSAGQTVHCYSSRRRGLLLWDGQCRLWGRQEVWLCVQNERKQTGTDRRHRYWSRRLAYYQYRCCDKLKWCPLYRVPLPLTMKDRLYFVRQVTSVGLCCCMSEISLKASNEIVRQGWNRLYMNLTSVALKPYLICSNQRFTLNIFRTSGLPLTLRINTEKHETDENKDYSNSGSCGKHGLLFWQAATDAGWRLAKLYREAGSVYPGKWQRSIFCCCLP